MQSLQMRQNDERLEQVFICSLQAAKLPKMAVNRATSCLALIAATTCSTLVAFPATKPFASLNLGS
eukprot:1158306-Pelagomonas_calceolata.AAC.15